MSRRASVLILSLCLLALCGAPSWAVGTASQTSVTNGVFNAGDTIPQAAGRLSISYRLSASIPDSRYVGYNSTGVAVVVDTGYDLDTIGRGINGYPADKTGNPGDTISYAYWIRNTGNATLTIYFDSVGHAVGLKDSGPSSGDASTNWNITGSYSVYYDSNNDGLWGNGDTKITSLVVPADASDTIIFVVLLPTDANDKETSVSYITVTNRAPRNSSSSTTGDGWQDSLPISTNDSKDTQTDTTVTTVVGPNVVVSKTMSELNGTRSRPGDTLVINITFDNDGGDSARGVFIYDAIPTNTRYVPWSADSATYLGNKNASANPSGDSDIKVAYDSDALGSTLNFEDTLLAAQAPNDTGKYVTAVRWQLLTNLGEDVNDGGDSANSADFEASGNYDNGRVEFRVVIQ